MISNEVDDDDDEDDDAATHVLPSKDVLGDTDLAELAELAESDFRPPRVRATPPPIPSRNPLRAAFERSNSAAWRDDVEAHQTLSYNESHGISYEPVQVPSFEDDDDLPTRVPPQAVVQPGHPAPLKSVPPHQFEELRPPVAMSPRPSARPPAVTPSGRPFDVSGMSLPHERPDMNFRGNEFPATPFKPPGTDLATKALLLLIIMLAAALAVVLVLIARR